MNANFKISDFKLEKYLTGDLPAEEMKALRLREMEDEIFHERVKAMREEGSKILAENPFENLSEKLDEVDAQGFAPRSSMPALLLKIAAVMVVALGLFTAIFVVNGEKNLGVRGVDERGSEVALAKGISDDYGETRIKGLNARMEVWKKTGETAVQMENLGVAREGDELQLRYSVPEKCYGLLFSMDGNGVLTVHLGNGSGSVALEPGKMVTLPFAYKLDNAPKFEKFFLMTSKNTFAIDGSNIDASLKQEGISVVEFTIRKLDK